MWPFTRKTEGNIPAPVFAAIIIATFSVCIAVGALRWAWLLMDEQIALRGELHKLNNRQTQVETQYEFWLRDLERERAAMNAGAKK